MPGRPLTPAETALARPVFGAAIDYSRVRLVGGAGGNPIAAMAFANGNAAITLGRRVHYRDGVDEDLAAAGTEARALLLHELTHVWQYRRLGMFRFLLRYVREFVAVGGRAAAMYRYAPGETRFAAARLEAQAQMIGDYAAAGWRRDAEAVRLLAGNLAGSGVWGL